MKVGIYARFSTDQQNDRSCADQEALCRDYAARQGWEIVGVYADHAVSGASVFGRPEFDRMTGAALAGRVDAILAEDLDRLSRNQADIARLYERMAFIGVGLWTVADGEINEMHIGLKGTMSALFLKNLRLKVRRGLAGVIRDGRSAGGQAYGYRPVPGQPGVLSIHDGEADVVRRIFAEFADGTPARSIAHRLAAEGIPSPRGGLWRGSALNGSKSRGHGILVNPLYAGRIVWGRTTFVKNPDTGRRISRVTPRAEWKDADAPHLRIVDEGTWQAVQRRLAAMEREPRQRPSRRLTHPLSGLLRCECCGSPMNIKDKQGARGRIICSNAKETGQCQNRRPYYLAGIERGVIGGLASFLADDSLARDYVTAYRVERRRLAAQTDRERHGLEARLAQAEREFERVYSAMKRGLITEDEAAADLPSLRAERDAIRARLLDDNAGADVIELDSAILSRYRRSIADLSASIGRNLQDGYDFAAVELRRMVQSVTVCRPDASGEVMVRVDGSLADLISPIGGVPLVAGEGLEPPTPGL